MENRVIEAHPRYHDWYKSVDEVTARNSRNRAVEVKRTEECSACPTIKTTRIDCTVWEDWRVLGKSVYHYLKGTTIVRISYSTFIRDRFLATTNLPMEDFGSKAVK